MLFYQLLKHVNVQFFKSNVQFNICISSTKLKERREKTKHNCKIRQFINIIKENCELLCRLSHFFDKMDSNHCKVAKFAII